MQLDEQTANSVVTRPTAAAPGSVRWFRERDLGGGITGTTMDADFLNDLLGNLIDLLAAGSITRTKGESGDSDLVDAIKAVIGIERAENALVGHLSRQSDSIIHLQPSNGADVQVGIDNTVLKTTGNIVFNMAADLEGAEAASTAYYLYLRNEAGALDAQISATVPDLPGGTKPGYKSGDATRRCVGSFWNNVGENIVECTWMHNGQVLFSNMDADHEHVLADTASTAWQNQNVNLPITAKSMRFIASFQDNTTGIVVYGADDAAGTITAATQDPFLAGLKDALYWNISTAGADNKGHAIAGEIPILTPATPAFHYGLSVAIDVGLHKLKVTGYTDIFAPR